MTDVRGELSLLNQKIIDTDDGSVKTKLYDELYEVRGRIWDTLLIETPDDSLLELGKLTYKLRGLTWSMSPVEAENFLENIRLKRLSRSKILATLDIPIWRIFNDFSEDPILDFIEVHGKSSTMRKVFENKKKRGIS